MSEIKLNEQHLVLFLEQHKDSATHLREYWQEQDEAREAMAYELLHSLKGSASVLKDIQLDHLLNTVLLDVERVEWRLVPAIIERLEYACNAPEKQTLSAGSENKQMLERLQQLIRQHNYAAIEMTRGWLSQPEPPIAHLELKRLLSCLESFDFQTAERYVNEQMTHKKID